jgi:hypothetical protein
LFEAKLVGFATPTVTFKDLNNLQTWVTGVANPVTLRLDDVQAVYSNADISDEIMEGLG